MVSFSQLPRDSRFFVSDLSWGCGSDFPPMLCGFSGPFVVQVINLSERQFLLAAAGPRTVSPISRLNSWCCFLVSRRSLLSIYLRLRQSPSGFLWWGVDFVLAGSLLPLTQVVTFGGFYVFRFDGSPFRDGYIPCIPLLLRSPFYSCCLPSLFPLLDVQPTL